MRLKNIVITDKLSSAFAVPNGMLSAMAQGMWGSKRKQSETGRLRSGEPIYLGSLNVIVESFLAVTWKGRKRGGDSEHTLSGGGGRAPEKECVSEDPYGNRLSHAVLTQAGSEEVWSALFAKGIRSSLNTIEKIKSRSHDTDKTPRRCTHGGRNMWRSGSASGRGGKVTTRHESR